VECFSRLWGCLRTKVEKVVLRSQHILNLIVISIEISINHQRNNLKQMEIPLSHFDLKIIVIPKSAGSKRACKTQITRSRKLGNNFLF